MIDRVFSDAFVLVRKRSSLQTNIENRQEGELDHSLARSTSKESRNPCYVDSEVSEDCCDHLASLSDTVDEVESEINCPIRLAS